MNTIKKLGFILLGTMLVSLLSATVINGWIDIPEMSTAANPPAYWWRLYFKSDGKLYKRSAAGVETALSGSASTSVIYLAAAGCDGANGASSFDLPGSGAPTAACLGTSYEFGALNFADSANSTATAHVRLPGNWDGTVDASVEWLVNASSAAAKWTLETACVSDNEDLLNPAFNTAQILSQTSSAIANQRNTVTQTGITVTGCSAGDELILRVGRDVSDASTATHSLLGVSLSVGRQ